MVSAAMDTGLSQPDSASEGLERDAANVVKESGGKGGATFAHPMNSSDFSRSCRMQPGLEKPKCGAGECRAAPHQCAEKASDRHHQRRSEDGLALDCRKSPTPTAWHKETQGLIITCVSGTDDEHRAFSKSFHEK